VNDGLAELGHALGLLTRLPVGFLLDGAPPSPRSVWAFPLAGLLVGAAGTAAFALAVWLGLPSWPAAFVALAAMALTTGGLHEDGLADTADGFSGGRTKERRLAIMRDSRIGSHGALALILAVGLRAAALAAIARPGPAAASLLAAGALSRAMVAAILWLLPPARTDGLGATFGRPGAGPALAGLLIGLALALVLLGPRAGLVASAAAALAATVVGALAWRRIGGQTGDICGATAMATECVALLALAVK
jgi:adenosylcobinamide-GDP ribazoletransferase